MEVFNPQPMAGPMSSDFLFLALFPKTYYNVIETNTKGMDR